MGTLNTHSKLSELEKTIMKKWLLPVSMRGVASSADLNAHKDNAEIHFKLAAGDNITIAEDPDTNTLTVNSAAEPFDGNLPDHDLRVGSSDYAYSTGQVAFILLTSLTVQVGITLTDKATGEQFYVPSKGGKWEPQEVADYINSVKNFPAVAEIDRVEIVSGRKIVYINLTAKNAGPNYTVTKEGAGMVISDMTGGKASHSIYLNGDDISPTSEITPGGTRPVTAGAVYVALAGKEETLEWDDVPTAGSMHPVYSDSIYTALMNKQNVLSCGTGIYINNNVISVDANGSVSLGDSAPVSGDTVARAIAALAPEPLPIDGTKLKHGHKYLVAIESDTAVDLSWIDLEDNASCELWIDVDESISRIPTITWPNAYWLDDIYDHTAPSFGYSMQNSSRYHCSLRKEGSLVVGRLAYVSPIPE